MTLRPVLCAAACLFVAACGKAPPTADPVLAPVTFHIDNEDPYDGPPWFEDAASAAGIDFRYRNGEEAGHFAILESLGGGAALLDYDRDGLIDIYLPGGGYYEEQKILGHPGRLYKNLGNFRFRDVTGEVGLDKPTRYTHGVAVADFNRDGFPDLLVTGYGGVTLYVNVPDGHGGRRFEDVTMKAGLDRGITWATSAVFADFDGDGWPDLYVCQYVDWSFENNPECSSDGKTRDVCPPQRFKGLPHRLYRNNGNGTFADVTATAFPRPPVGRGLGVLAVDVNGDGRPDLYVANDTDPNFLYVNRSKPGEIRFEEVAGAAGVAVDNSGRANGSMGLDAADVARTGRPALFVTNYEGELHALYANHTDGDTVLFDYESHRNGLRDLGPRMVGWGTAFLDLDRDGWEDLVIVHGHAVRFSVTGSGRAQYPKLLVNERGKFAPASNRGGSYFRARHDARGLAVGDLDNDGKPDLVVSHVNEPVAVLRNVVPTDHHWVGFELAGEKFRDLAGGRIVVKAGDQTYTRFLKAGGSYCSANDPRQLVGIATATRVDSVTVHWPHGKAQEWENLAADRYWKLTEGDPTAK